MQRWSKELTQLTEILKQKQVQDPYPSLNIKSYTAKKAKIDVNNLMDKAENFFNHYNILLHDVLIGSFIGKDAGNLYIKDKKISLIILELALDFFIGEIDSETYLSELEQIQEYIINYYCKKQSPYNIPIKTAPWDMGSCISNIGYCLESGYDNIILPTRHYVSEIFLSYYDKYILDSILVHELVHSQFLDDDTVYREVLPIFFELLCADNNKLVLKHRLYSLLQTLEKQQTYYTVSTDSCPVLKDEIMYGEPYMVSTISALSLYYKYQNGGKDEKENILKEIREIFNGNNSVENLLNHFKTINEIEVVKQYVRKR